MHNIWLYILVMAIVTYLIRALPLTLIRRRISNRCIRDFLYYVPYVTLSAMTVPAVFYATDSMPAAFLGFALAFFLAYRKKSLLTVAAGACLAVFLAELFLV